MGGTVKKVAAVAALGFGGYALAGGLGSFGYMGSKLGTGGFFSSLMSSKALAAAGLGLNVASQIQQRKFAGEQKQAMERQAAEQRRVEEARARFAAVQAKRQRQEAVRRGRIRQGTMLASAAGIGGGLGVAQGGGTSGLTGGIGAVSTQVARQIGDINVAESTGEQLSAANIRAAGYATQAVGAQAQGAAWSQMATLGSSIFSNAQQLSSIFGGGSQLASAGSIEPFKLPTGNSGGYNWDDPMKSIPRGTSYNPYG